MMWVAIRVTQPTNSWRQTGIRLVLPLRRPATFRWWAEKAGRVPLGLDVEGQRTLAADPDLSGTWLIVELPAQRR
jgi:hypothetical protein